MRPRGELGIALDSPQEAVTLGQVVDGACELLGKDDPLRISLEGIAAAAREHADSHGGEADEFRHPIEDPETVMVLLSLIWSAGANHADPAVRGRADNMIASYETRKYGVGSRGTVSGPWADAA
jgi:hypothetical protein